MQVAAAAYEHLHLAAQGVQVDVQRAHYLRGDALALVDQPEHAACSWPQSRQENAASGQSPAPTCQGGDSGPGASRSRVQGWRGLIAGSMQHGAPLRHEVQKFDGG
jgi:hypothetical protein